MFYEHHDWNKMEWEVVFDGLKRKVIGTDGATMVLNHIEPGAEVPIHTHPHRQIIYVISGEGDLTLENEKRELGTGCLAIMEPNAPHGYLAKGQDTVIMLDTFIPKRKEYEDLYQEAIAQKRQG